ncbi:MAG: hypothetical protein RQM92_04015 [Candidatus Syntrophopropionicum ammoniitolerans]
MKLKTSFINQGILRNDLKRFTWIGVTYLLLLLASVPLKILMWHSREQAQQINYIADYIRIFQFAPYPPTQIMIFIIVPVVAGLLLFRYLQDSRSADMAHALPVNRGPLQHPCYSRNNPFVCTADHHRAGFLAAGGRSGD